MLRWCCCRVHRDASSGRTSSECPTELSRRGAEPNRREQRAPSAERNSEPVLISVSCAPFRCRTRVCLRDSPLLFYPGLNFSIMSIRYIDSARTCEFLRFRLVHSSYRMPSKGGLSVPTSINDGYRSSADGSPTLSGNRLHSHSFVTIPQFDFPKKGSSGNDAVILYE